LSARRVGRTPWMLLVAGVLVLAEIRSSPMCLLYSLGWVHFESLVLHCMENLRKKVLAHMNRRILEQGHMAKRLTAIGQRTGWLFQVRTDR
jgi:hypothetical protein